MNSSNITIKEAEEITTTTRISVVVEAEVDEIEVEINIQIPNDMRRIKEPMVTSMTEPLKDSSRGVKAVAAEEVVVEEDEAEAVAATLIARIVKTPM